MTTPRLVMFRAGGNPGEHPLPVKAAVIPRVTAAPQVLLADISEFQPEVTDELYCAWSRAIIIRACYGAAHDDRAWYGGQRRDLLHQYGIRWLGIYQYVVAGQDPVRQADALGALLGALRPGEKIIGDFEEGTGDQSHRRDLWAARISQLGDQPWTYSGMDYAAAHGLAPVDWVAAYQAAEPAVPHKLWQFTDSFAVPGVGTCDCSVFHGSIDELAALAYQPRTALTEDDMTPIVLGLPADGPATVLPVPAGAKTLTLYADDGYNSPAVPHVRVVWEGPGRGVQEAMPRWSAPAVLPVPAGSGSVSLARADAGSTPVTAAWT